jgi:DNA-binding response OmpR family regulator
MARVLVVDDDPAGLEIRRLVLQRHGHEVIAASDAESARAAFVQFKPDVIVLDVRLPDPSDGLALIREFAGTRTVVLCGNRADLDHRPEAGMAAEILSKPVRIEVLLKAIEKKS